MVSERVERDGGAGLPAERVVAAGSAARTLVAATARALRGDDCGDLGHPGGLSRLGGAPEPDRKSVV